MIAYLEKALNLKRQEFAPAALLFLYLFCAIGSYVIGQSVGDALFLSAFPKYLPQGIIATAVLVGIFTSIYIRLSRRVPLENLIIGSLLLFASGFLIFWWLTRSHGQWVYALLYTWVYAVGALAPTMGWTLANCSLTTREARRVFGLVGAGGILGAPCAGFLTAALTRNARVKPETLLLAITLGLVLCAICVKSLFHIRRGRLAEVDSQSSAAGATPNSLFQVWSYIRDSRYLLLITALITIGCCTTTVVGYQFKMIARESFHGDKAALAAFFGTFQGYIGFFSFFLQILLTGRLLRSLGIRVTLFLMPAVFLVGSMGVLLAPVLLSAAVLRASQGLLRYSVDKSTTELLYLPVTPAAIKNQIKSFIDGFVWRMADGIGGIALLLFANPLNFSPSRMSIVNFVFLTAWIAVAYGVRREYLTVLRSAIELHKLDPEKIATGLLDGTTVDVLAHSLENAGEQQILYGLSLFELGNDPAWHPALVNLLEHPSATVRERALHLLNESRRHGLASQVEKMLGDESLEVRAEALQYLVVQEHKDPLLLLQTGTEVPAHYLQSAAIIHLTRIGDVDCNTTATHILKEMIAAGGLNGVVSRREAARALGRITGMQDLHVELHRLIDDPVPEVAEHALLSAGRLAEGKLLPAVVQKLAEPRLRGPARAAVVQYGNAAVGTLQAVLNDPATPFAVRREIPRTLARIATPLSAATLSGSLVQSDPDIRHEVIRALNWLRVREPQLLPAPLDAARMLDYELLAHYRSFQILAALEQTNGIGISEHEARDLLVQAMRERMNQEFERIFRLLGLTYPPRDIYNVYLGLISRRPQLQANALEVLEHLLPAELYRHLAPIADIESTVQQRLEWAQRLCQTSVDSLPEALRILLTSGDRWLCACALYTITRMRLTELAADVHALRHDDPLLETTWKYATASLNSNEKQNGGGMLTLLERVDLLRNAALFKDLPAESLVRVAAIANELSWAPQQVVYQENSPAESLFFLLEGELELSRGGNVIARRGNRQLFGGLAALANGSHSESAVVSKQTRVLRMDREELLEVMAEDFRVAQGIVKALAGMADSSIS